MKIIAIAFKDLTRSMRSLFLIGMTLLAPLLITLLIYFAFGSMIKGDVSMTAIQVGVVNQDDLPANSHLDSPVGMNIQNMFFDDSVKPWINARILPDEISARNAVNSQEIGVAVIIPATFTNDYLSGNTKTPIIILQDPTLSIGPKIVGEMVSSLLDGVAGGGVAYKVISARLQDNNKPLEPAIIQTMIQSYVEWYTEFQKDLLGGSDQAALVVSSPKENNVASNTLQSVMGLVMAGQLVFFSFFTGAYAMMSILQEAEDGTLARLFTTPTNRTIILFGKFLAVFLTVLIQGIVLLIAGRVIFGIHWGEPFTMLLALLGQMITSVGLAVLLVSIIKTIKQAGPIFGGALSTLGMLSGLFTTNIAMPDSFNAIANLTPQGWVLKAWKLSLAGQPFSEMILPCVVLVLMGIVMFAIGAMLFRKRFA